MFRIDESQASSAYCLRSDDIWNLKVPGKWTLGFGSWWSKSKYLATYRVVFHIIYIYCFQLYIDTSCVTAYALIHSSKFWQLLNHGQENNMVQIDRTLGPQRRLLKIKISHKRWYSISIENVSIQRSWMAIIGKIDIKFANKCRTFLSCIELFELGVNLFISLSIEIQLFPEFWCQCSHWWSMYHRSCYRYAICWVKESIIGSSQCDK